MVDPEPTSNAYGSRPDDGAADRTTAPKKYRPSMRLTAIAVVVLVMAGILEGGARLVYAWQDQIRSLPLISNLARSALNLEPYNMPSPRWPGHWVLRPGYQATMQQILADKKHSDRAHGVSAIETSLKTPGHELQAVLRINQGGFKGPDLDPSHSRPRILMLGDSTTFGIGVVDYPRVAEKILDDRGVAAEVVNGGVEGYTPRDVLLELDRYRALKPEIATLYVGWNALYKQAPWPDAWENRLRIVWLAVRAYRAFQTRLNPIAYARGLLDREPKPDPQSPDVISLGAYVPPFMDDIERIADGLTAAGADVFLVTLPGLFTPLETPTPQALAIGHLPPFTDNPAVLAMLTARYNAALRDLARHRGLGIIDLEKWSIEALRPRDANFVDSVHLAPTGLELIGVFIAEQLAARIESLKKRKSGAGNR